MLKAAKTDPVVIRPSSYKKLSAHFCCNVDGCMITEFGPQICGSLV